MNDLIDKEIYIVKKKEYDDEIIKTEEYIKELNCNNIPIGNLTEKISNMKTIIKEKFKYKTGELNEDMVDSFVDKILIKSNEIDYYLNFNSDTIIVLGDNTQRIHIAKLVVTKDDLKKYSAYCSELTRVKFNDNIIVNLYL